MRRDPWLDSCPDFPDLMTRLSRLKLLARICNLGLNPDAARPLARLMSRLSRPYVQTFPTQTLGANLQFGSKSGCGATRGAACPDFPDLLTKTFNTQTLSVNVNLGPNPDAARPWRDSCPHFPDLMSRLSRLEHSAQICNLGLNLMMRRDP